MSGEAWLYLFAVLINAVNLFLQVFFTIMYSDLEWYAPNMSSLTLRSLHPAPIFRPERGMSRRAFRSSMSLIYVIVSIIRRYGIKLF